MLAESYTCVSFTEAKRMGPRPSLHLLGWRPSLVISGPSYTDIVLWQYLIADQIHTNMGWGPAIIFIQYGISRGKEPHRHA